MVIFHSYVPFYQRVTQRVSGKKTCTDDLTMVDGEYPLLTALLSVTNRFAQKGVARLWHGTAKTSRRGPILDQAGLVDWFAHGSFGRRVQWWFWWISTAKL